MRSVCLYTSLMRDQMRSSSSEKGINNCYQMSFSEEGESRTGLVTAVEGFAPL